MEFDGITLQSTGDIDLASLRGRSGEMPGVHVDDRQYFFKSASQAPSFINVIASWPTWAKLLGAAGAIAAHTVVQEATKGAIARRRAIAVAIARLPKRILDLAEGLVWIAGEMPIHGVIYLALPLENEHFPAQMTIRDMSLDGIADSILAFGAEAESIARYLGDNAIRPAVSVQISIETDVIKLQWQDFVTLAPQQATIPRFQKPSKAL